MKISLTSLERLQEAADHGETHPRCSRCGGADLEAGLIRVAFWQADRLVVVQGVPARICGDCGEEFVDAATAQGLDRMKTGDFLSPTRTQLIVPVYDFAPLAGAGA